MVRNCFFAFAALLAMAFICNSDSHAQAMNNSKLLFLHPRLDLNPRALIGTWEGDWRTASGDAGGKVRLVIGFGRDGESLTFIIEFLSGANIFGKDPFVTDVNYRPLTQGPFSLAPFEISGTRNGASFVMNVNFKNRNVLHTVKHNVHDGDEKGNLHAELVRVVAP